jgi:hypothetical protein
MKKNIIDERIKILKEKIYLSVFCRKYGFSISDSRIISAEEVFSGCYRLGLVNDSNISIEIICDLFAEGPSEKIAVYILNNVEDDEIALNRYMRKNNVEEDPFDLVSYSGIFGDKIDGFLGFLEASFGAPILDAILKDSCWEDIEFDRQDYK